MYTPVQSGTDWIAVASGYLDLNEPGAATKNCADNFPVIAESWGSRRARNLLLMSCIPVQLEEAAFDL